MIKEFANYFWQFKLPKVSSDKQSSSNSNDCCYNYITAAYYKNTISNYNSNNVNSSRLLLFPSLSSGYWRNTLVFQAGGTVPLLGGRLFKTNTSKMKLQTGYKEISWVIWSVFPVEEIDSEEVIPTHSYGHPSSLSQAIIWKEKQLDKKLTLLR